MPITLKGRRAGLALSQARGKQFFMQTQAGDFLQSQAGTPGGNAISRKAGRFGDIAIDYPDPYAAALMVAGAVSQPRFVGAHGELLSDVYPAPDPAGLAPGTESTGVYYGIFRHLGGGFYATLLTNGLPNLNRSGVLVFSPDWIYSVPAMFYTDSQDRAGIPSISVCPLGEFAPGVFRYLVTLQHPHDITGANPLQDGGFPVMYMFSTDALAPGTGTRLALPIDGRKHGYVPYVTPLGRGRAIYVQAYHDTVPGTNTDPQIMRIEDWTTVSLGGHVSDIDPTVTPGGLYSAADLSWRMHFTKVGPTHIVFHNGSGFFELPPRLFLSSNDGASWAPITLPVEITSSRGIPIFGTFNRTPIDCFGVGCFGMVVRNSTSTGYDYFYTLNYGASWTLLPMTGLAPIAQSPYNDFDVRFVLTALRPYVNADDKGELAVVHKAAGGNVPRSLYVTTDLGATWNYRASIIDQASAYDGVNGFNDFIEFVGEPLLTKAPILAGLPGTLEL